MDLESSKAVKNMHLSHEVTSESDIMPCNKIDNQFTDYATLRNYVHFNVA